jgi:rod shape determining protein RodA
MLSRLREPAVEVEVEPLCSRVVRESTWNSHQSEFAAALPELPAVGMRRFLSLRDFDWTLLGFVMILSVISVLEIYSATLHTKFHGFQRMQILWIAGGLAAMFVMSVLDYHKLLSAIYWIYAFCLVALVAVLAVGTRVNGGRRWIRLGGGVHFQPSEWVKLVLIVLVARYFANLSGRDLTWSDILKAIAFVAVPMLLVLKQPDLGTALTYSPVLLMGLFLGGIDWRKGGVILLVLLLGAGVVWKSGKILKPYQKARLTSFTNPDADPRGSGYQILQSKIAVGDGGVFGRGARQGTQTQGDFLPIPYTDFIFAAFSEEHGFVGAILVLLLYFLILMRLIQNAQTAADLPGSFLVMGVAAVLLFQIAVNVGMVLGLMPVTGIPLPLMSYGGSSVLFTFLALGMVMNVRMSRFVN